MDVSNDTMNKSSSARESKRPRSARLRRIGDYRRQALAHPDPLLANVAAGNSELMKIVYYLNKQICRALASSASIEESAALSTSLVVGLQVNRQIDRFTQLEARMRTPALPAPPGGALGPALRVPPGASLSPTARVPPGDSLDEVSES
jgi:hypothetical protein